MRRIRRRIEEERSKPYDESMRMLIPQLGEKVWGEKRVGNKVDMIGEWSGLSLGSILGMIIFV